MTLWEVHFSCILLQLSVLLLLCYSTMLLYYFMLHYYMGLWLYIACCMVVCVVVSVCDSAALMKHRSCTVCYDENRVLPCVEDFTYSLMYYY